MVALSTPKCTPNWEAPDFSLMGVDGKNYTLRDCLGPRGTLVMFICNHCPYVKAIIDRVVRDAKELEQYGIRSVAIMPNDTQAYPDDSFDNMKKFAEENKFSFPYLIDSTQEVAKAYGAVCTPDFFGFNIDGKLQYRGRLDPSRIDPIPNAPRELFDALVTMSKTGLAPKEQFPSMGCSIKWRT